MLVITPNRETIAAIKKIQAEFNKHFAGEGKLHNGCKQKKIHCWKQMPAELLHMTLLLGDREANPRKGMSLEQRQAVMKKVAEKVVNLQPIQVEASISKTDVVEGTTKRKVNFERTDEKFNSLLLHIHTDCLEPLFKKVREAVSELQQQGIITNDNLKLKDGFKPHFTIGMLDISGLKTGQTIKEYKSSLPPQQQTDLENFQNKQVDNAVKGCVLEDLKGINFKFTVDCVHLVGVENIGAKVDNKRYYDLATCKLNSPNELQRWSNIASKPQVVNNANVAPKPNVVDNALVNAFQNMTVADKYLISALNSIIVENLPQNIQAAQVKNMTFERDFDENNNPTIRVLFGFPYNELVNKSLKQKIDPSITVWNDKDTGIFSYIHLNEFHCKKLLGNLLGGSIYKELTENYLEKLLLKKLSEIMGNNLPINFTTEKSKNIMTCKKRFDENNKRTIHVEFNFKMTESDRVTLENYLKQQLDPTINVRNNGERYYIRLGEVRCKTLLGNELGAQVYQTLTKD